jgi:hypothetical protein
MHFHFHLTFLHIRMRWELNPTPCQRPRCIVLSQPAPFLLCAFSQLALDGVLIHQLRSPQTAPALTQMSSGSEYPIMSMYVLMGMYPDFVPAIREAAARAVFGIRRALPERSAARGRHARVRDRVRQRDNEITDHQRRVSLPAVRSAGQVHRHRPEAFFCCNVPHEPPML